MKQIIETRSEKCRGCAECIRVCPVKDANIACVSADKPIVRINSIKCIACGACLKVCAYDARFYNDDTEQFFDDLSNRVPVALIVAPTFRENFENWRSVLAWLKTKGISVIVDVSVGIALCTWAHIRYIEQYNPTLMITQPCPPLVGYIEKHCPQLSKKISPVQSPILCTSIYLKNTLKLPDKIAALTPCPAKTNEFAEANTVSYNVTFKMLADYITTYKISIPQADFDFDNITVAPGRAFATPGSLADSERRITGCINLVGSKSDIDIIKNRGNVYRYIDVISREEPVDFPVLLDALNCVGGCGFGAGCNIKKSNFQHMPHRPCEDEAKHDSEQVNLFLFFDSMLKLSDFIKEHPDQQAEKFRP